jgi:hypothetical protein
LQLARSPLTSPAGGIVPRAALPLVALLIAACQLPPPRAAALPPAQLPVEMQGAHGDTEFSVTAGEGRVVVADRTVSGVCHRSEDHGAYLEGDTLHFWIAFTGSTGDMCIALARLGAYRATITGVPPGSYTVRVSYIGGVNSGSHPEPMPDTRVAVR